MERNRKFALLPLKIDVGSLHENLRTVVGMLASKPTTNARPGRDTGYFFALNDETIPDSKNAYQLAVFYRNREHENSKLNSCLEKGTIVCFTNVTEQPPKDEHRRGLIPGKTTSNCVMARFVPGKGHITPPKWIPFFKNAASSTALANGTDLYNAVTARANEVLKWSSSFGRANARSFFSRTKYENEKSDTDTDTDTGKDDEYRDDDDDDDDDTKTMSEVLTIKKSQKPQKPFCYSNEDAGNEYISMYCDNKIEVSPAISSHLGSEYLASGETKYTLTSAYQMKPSCKYAFCCEILCELANNKQLNEYLVTDYTIFDNSQCANFSAQSPYGNILTRQDIPYGAKVKLVVWKSSDISCKLLPNDYVTFDGVYLFQTPNAGLDLRFNWSSGETNIFCPAPENHIAHLNQQRHALFSTQPRSLIPQMPLKASIGAHENTEVIVIESDDDSTQPKEICVRRQSVIPENEEASSLLSNWVREMQRKSPTKLTCMSERTLKRATVKNIKYLDEVGQATTTEKRGFIVLQAQIRSISPCNLLDIVTCVCHFCNAKNSLAPDGITCTKCRRTISSDSIYFDFWLEIQDGTGSINIHVDGAEAGCLLNGINPAEVHTDISTARTLVAQIWRLLGVRESPRALYDNRELQALVLGKQNLLQSENSYEEFDSKNACLVAVAYDKNFSGVKFNPCWRLVGTQVSAFSSAEWAGILDPCVLEHQHNETQKSNFDW